MKDVVIVTRHPALVALLRERGIEGRVLTHASPEDVRGRHVVGVLPLHLAALADLVTVPVMELRPEDRGRELTLEEVRERFRGLETYSVKKVDSLLELPKNNL